MGDEPVTTPPPPPPPTGTDETTRLAELNRWAQSIAASEKSQGKAQATRELADSLGMSLDEAKTFIENAKKAERDKMTEADAKLAEAAEREAAASRRDEAASRRELSAEIRAQLIEAKLTREQASHIVDLVKVDVKDWDEAKVTAAIELTKKTFPQLFPVEEESEGSGTQTPPPNAQGHSKPVHSAPAGTPPPNGGGGAQTPEDKARARLLERHPDQVKSTS